MNDLHIAPMSLEILGDQATVAVFGFVLTAQQASVGDRPSYPHLPNSSLVHECEELALVRIPVVMFIPISVQHLLGGRQLRHMHILHTADCVQKVFKVILLGETRQLRHVVQPNV